MLKIVTQFELDVEKLKQLEPQEIVEEKLNELRQVLVLFR